MVDSRPAPGASTPSRRSLAWARPRAGLPPLWIVALVLVVGIPNLAAAWSTIETILTQGYAFDWVNFLRAADRLSAGTIYDFSGNYTFRWSPLAAWAFGFIAPIGLLAWRIAHLAALALLRDWRLIVVALLSYPFWFDVETGNINTFVAVAAVGAWRGSRLATGLYLLLLLLVPRPLAAPLALWILWKRPEWRWPFVVALVAEVAAVLAMGLGSEWLRALVGASSEFHADLNLGPSALIGAWWLPIGAAASIWFLYRGRLGLASLAASPYWLPYYFLMLLLELVPPAMRDQRRTQTTAVESV